MRGKNELDKSKVKSLYLDGFSANEIAIRMDSNREAVKKCIQRNFYDLREHNKAKRELKKLQNEEIRKITHRECKKFMSDRNFVKTNSSIYKHNGHGNFSVKKEEEIGCVVPFDVPKHFSFKKKF
ncbi:helix-turn-helix domain-containing protein [Clostridium perfringens]|nr:helix-turn-helix domain-containing protein [Clostridium perfringens]ELC8454876.1 helix-turn-helix domain-containing protein [Clostridium perfringens]